MRKINKQAGFTLIELIMVIVILGVLSAFALPRFADLGGDARTASISALGGAVKAAANIAHAQQLANGESGVEPVDLDGANGITMVAGYPTANGSGIGAAAQISAVDYASTVAGETIFYTIEGFTVVVTDPVTTCQVSYTPTNAVVVVDTDGC
jgi:MSHA pilin protein MshA